MYPHTTSTQVNHKGDFYHLHRGHTQLHLVAFMTEASNAANRQFVDRRHLLLPPYSALFVACTDANSITTGLKRTAKPTRAPMFFLSGAFGERPSVEVLLYPRELAAIRGE